MLRMKNSNIFVVFTSLSVLYLWFCLMAFLWFVPTYAQPMKMTASPIRQLPFYVVDAEEIPGTVYRIQNEKPNVFFRRPSGSISSISIWGGQLFFCSGKDGKIYQRMGQRERVVFEHRGYIRDIAVDPNGNLNFSEANCDKGDGRVFQLIPPIDELGPEQKFSISKKEKPINIALKTVDGFWDGSFTFDPQNNLYLSTGDHIPACIYKADKLRESQYNAPEKIYRNTRGVIKGIAIEPNVKDPNNPDYIFYADWGRSIFRMKIDNLKRSVAFSGRFSFSKKEVKSNGQHLSDVAFDIKIEER
ncbi:MAG: hypothetical protein ACYSTT_12915 [Planctomycetota bacterium]